MCLRNKNLIVCGDRAVRKTAALTKRILLKNGGSGDNVSLASSGKTGEILLYTGSSSGAGGIVGQLVDSCEMCILNGDDMTSRELAVRLDGRDIRYSFNFDGAEVVGKNLRLPGDGVPENTVSFEVIFGERITRVMTEGKSAEDAQAALAAVAGAMSLGVSLEGAAEALRKDNGGE